MKLQMKPTQARLQAEAISSHPDFDRGPRKEIGRASCRERVSSPV